MIDSEFLRFSMRPPRKPSSYQEKYFFLHSKTIIFEEILPIAAYKFAG